MSLHLVPDVPNWLFSACSFICGVLVLIPFPWHLEAWNTGTCLYMGWAGLACFNYFINSVVWNGNVIDWAPAWCDISAKFMIGVTVGIPAASLCINRRLYHIASVQSVTVTKKEKRRAVMTDLAIGLGIPFVEMILHTIVQGDRYDIFEDIGCFADTWNTPLAYVLVFCWPLVIGMVSAVYCILTIRAFAARRAQFKELLSMNANLNSGRYFRLMALAGVELILTIPLSSWSIYLNVSSGMVPYVSWDHVHSNFTTPGQFPAVEWRQSKLSVISLETTRWFLILCVAIFFGFFGFADEARKNYKLAYTSMAKRVGITTVGSTTAVGDSTINSKSGGITSTNGQRLPVIVTQETMQRRDSGMSFDEKLTDFTMSLDYSAFDAIKDQPPSPIDDESSFSSGSSAGSIAEVPRAHFEPPSLSRVPSHATDLPSTPVMHTHDMA